MLPFCALLCCADAWMLQSTFAFVSFSTMSLGTCSFLFACSSVTGAICCFYNHPPDKGLHSSCSRQLQSLYSGTSRTSVTVLSSMYQHWKGSRLSSEGSASASARSHALPKTLICRHQPEGNPFLKGPSQLCGV